MTGKPDKAAFARRLKALMAKKGWNQTHFAWELFGDARDGYPAGRDKVSKWLKGVNMPDPENLERIAKLFGLTVAELVTVEDPPKPGLAFSAVSVPGRPGMMRVTVEGRAPPWLFRKLLDIFEAHGE